MKPAVEDISVKYPALEKNALPPDVYICISKIYLVEKKSSSNIERGYFGSISSGWDFQFFSAHFFSKSRTDTRVGAFDRYTLPTYWKIIKKSCNFLKKVFRYTEVGIFQNSRPSKIANLRNFWGQKFEKTFFREWSNMILQTYYEGQIYVLFRVFQACLEVTYHQRTNAR